VSRYAERNLALDCVRVTEAAALAGARMMGRGDERAADEAGGSGDGDAHVRLLELG